jgi:predicted O-linked N-acetylglucosamine transferase (SPINDLY family)
MPHTEPPGNADFARPDQKGACIAVVHSWLQQWASAEPEGSHPLGDLVEPYADILVGYAKAAVSKLEVLLQKEPAFLHAAILMGGALHVTEPCDSIIPIQFQSSDDPDQRKDLQPKVLACLNRLSQPLLERSKLAGSIGAALSRPNAAMMLRYYARLCNDFDARDGSITCLAHAIEIWPEAPSLYLDLFTDLMDTLQFVPALELILSAQQKFPKDPDILRAMSLFYRSQGMPKESLHWCGKLHRMDPYNFPDAIAYRCFVPTVCNSPEEARSYRSRYMRGLLALERKNFNPMASYRGDLPVPSFSLAYQNVNNLALLERQASVFRHAYRPFFDKVNSLNPPAQRQGRTRKKIKVAFISEFFSTHTNALAFEGLIKYLDKERFHTILLHNAASIRDATRDRLDSYCHEAIVLPMRLDLAAEQIHKLDLDVLFYTDIGMSPSLYLLAMARLAPLQVTGWGIPHTSGINTIDFYISTSLSEPTSAVHHYTEALHLVSRMPCCYLRENLPIHTLNRSYFFLPEEAFIFACLQQLHKLHPDFDELLEELAQRNPNALFVFAEHNRPLLTHRVLERWKCRAPTMMDQSRLLAHMNRKEFAALCSCVDLLLDPPYYGSGITFYESAHTGTPTLSLQGKYLRSRFVAGAYRMLGLVNPPVATSPTEYIEIASALARDADKLKNMTSSLAYCAEQYLYDDTLYVREVEQFLINNVR